MSGWGAAMFNIFVTFPVNKTVFRQQVYGFSMQDALIQLKAEGHSIYIRTVALKNKTELHTLTEQNLTKSNLN